MGTTIMIVDDSRVSRMMIHAHVTDMRPNWDVIEANDGQNALELVDAKEIHMAIIDFNMPGLDGITLGEKLQNKYPDAIFSMLTANIQESTRKKAKDLGFHFVKKPITSDKIKEILDLYNKDGT